MSKIYDLAIIGSGPAGLTAGIYAIRAKLDTVLIEKSYMSGGQIINTMDIDNYPALPGINGFDLALKMRSHYDDLGGQIMTNKEVTEVKNGAIKEVIFNDGTSITTKTLIIATGASHRKLNVPGEDTLAGSGVSYCATCDAAFFRDRTVAVVGGGDVALEDAFFLSRLCKKVYVIHRRDAFRGAPVIAEKLLAQENVSVIWDSVVSSIDGKDKVEAIQIDNIKDHTKSTLPIDGVFVAIGMSPVSEIYQGLVDIDDYGYIIADESCRTSAEGIFAAGDIRTKPLRQIINAAADGAAAVYAVQQYLNQN